MQLRTSTLDKAQVDAFDSLESYDSMHNDILNNRVEIKPLNRYERDLAQIFIDKEHPLKEIPIWVALPFFRSCKRCFKGGEEASVEKANGIAELF